MMFLTRAALGALCLVSVLYSAGCAGRHSGEELNPALFTSSDRYCPEHTGAMHAPVVADSGARPNDELTRFQQLVAQSLTYRQETVRLAGYLKEKGEQGRAYSGEDIESLNLGTAAHLKLRKELYAVAQAHECWLDAPDRFPMNDRERLAGVMLSLSAALTLYDNYLLAISSVDCDAKLRRFLNRSDSGYQKNRSELDRVTADYNSVGNRERVRKAMRFYEQETAKLTPQELADPAIDYLNRYIKESPSYAMVREYAPVAVLGKQIGFLGAVTSDTVVKLEEEGLNLFSMLFGNVTGMIASREGKLYDRPPLTQRIRQELRAGDILVEKTPFRLTDSFIPGFWGHAAIWVGSEDELKELGIWEEPVVQQYRKQISEGRLVVEALRTGVEMNSLEQFLNIDDLGVLRQKEIAPSERAAVVLRALRQVGKGYNFNFDVEASDKVVCSGLVYLAYAKLPWQTEKTLGRVTISPDQVAANALAGGPLEVALLIHDGEWVEKDRLETMTELMGGRRELQARR